ncbi:MAG: hypothetical protein NXI24_15880 [bacterium]|nr:hypothetical protein [bacterium]
MQSGQIQNQAEPQSGSGDRDRRKGRKKPSKLRQFSEGLQKAADLARHPLGRFLVDPLMRFYARKTMRIQGVQPPGPDADIETIALEYQRMFPTKRMYEIVDIKDDTAYFDIHVQCPLRGTGDAMACHRLMQYDRSMADRLGVNFRVLESQSVSGADTCRVAIRRHGLPVSDLPEPHEGGKA